MSARSLSKAILFAITGLLATGCATTKPYDYTNFRQHRPRSILVLPPLNNSTDVRGTYGYFSTVTRPLAEMGYYVFPIVIVDQFLKENGLPGPGEMHQAPLDKFAKIFGTDSVLYITLEQYGTKYHVLNSVTRVAAKASLVDARTGLLLWEGQAAAEQRPNGGGGGGGGLIGALVQTVVRAVVNQAVNSSVDTAHPVSGEVNTLMFMGNSSRSFGSSPAVGVGGPPLLYGPYRPEGEPYN